MTSANRLVAVVCVAAAVFITGACSIFGTDSARETEPVHTADAHLNGEESPTEAAGSALEMRDDDPPLTRYRLLAALPEETLALTPEAALAFAAYFVDLQYEMYAPPYHSSLYATLSSTECVFCGMALSRVTGYEEAQETQTKDPCRSNSDDGYVLKETDYYWTVFQFCDGGTTTFTRAESVVEVQEYPTYCLEMAVAWTNTHWMAVGAVAYEAEACPPPADHPSVEPVNHD